MRSVTKNSQARPRITAPPNPERARASLGINVRALREASGLSGKQLGDLIGISQSLVSKYERGTSKISRETLEKVMKALNASAPERSAPVSKFELSQLPALSMRAVIAGGVENRQREIRDYEQYVRNFAQFEQTVIPGLLQLPNYTREVLARFGVPEASIEAAISERRQRQHALTQSERSFHFVIAETVLYTPISTVGVLIEQLRWLMMNLEWAHVRIGLVPAVHGNVPGALTGFMIYDGRYVTTETVVTEQFVANPPDVKTFVSLHEEAVAIAVYGEQARDLVKRAIDALERGASAGQE